MPTREVCDIFEMSTRSYVVYWRSADGREFLGLDRTQRRPEIFVVIVQKSLASPLVMYHMAFPYALLGDRYRYRFALCMGPMSCLYCLFVYLPVC